MLAVDTMLGSGFPDPFSAVNQSLLHPLRGPFALLTACLMGLSSCRSTEPAGGGESAEILSTPAGWSDRADADARSRTSITAALEPRRGGDLSRCTLTVTLDFEPGWHGYAEVPPESGLRAATIGLSLPKGVELLGPWRRPAGVASADGAGHLIYEGQVTFSREVALPPVPTGELEVTVDYQVCNESICLPPHSVPLTLAFGMSADAAVPATAAASPTSSVEVDAPAAVAALLAEHAASELGFVEAGAAFRPRFEAFAAAHRGTEAEATALLWLLGDTWWQREDGTMESSSGPIVDALLERHADSPRLEEVVQCAYVLSKDKKAAVLEQLLESPHAAVRAAVYLARAKADLRGRQPESAERLRTNCEILLSDYAAVPYYETTYGAMARACLERYPSESLEVGQTAPDITGEDVSGVPFALSDYRGQVVLLDFWGDW